jgi:hypothetical protein
LPGENLDDHDPIAGELLWRERHWGGPGHDGQVFLHGLPVLGRDELRWRGVGDLLKNAVPPELLTGLGTERNETDGVHALGDAAGANQDVFEIFVGIFDVYGTQLRSHDLARESRWDQEGSRGPLEDNTP